MLLCFDAFVQYLVDNKNVNVHPRSILRVLKALNEFNFLVERGGWIASDFNNGVIPPDFADSGFIL